MIDRSIPFACEWEGGAMNLKSESVLGRLGVDSLVSETARR